MPARGDAAWQLPFRRGDRVGIGAVWQLPFPAVAADARASTGRMAGEPQQGLAIRQNEPLRWTSR